jgi:amino acid transporter
MGTNFHVQFYIASIFLIGLLVPYTHPELINPNQSYDSKASPFVIALKNSGVKGLPSVINSVILITVLSVANSSVYGSSRVLIAMADAGLAPKAFTYVDTKGRPLRCFYLSFAFGLLAYLVDLRNENTVFIWLVSLCGLSSIISWTSICATHIRFRQALRLHNKKLESLPYQSPIGVIGSWIGLVCNIFIIVLQFVTDIRPVGYYTMTGHQRAVSFFQSFMAFPLIGIIYFCFKFFKGTKIHGVVISKKGVKFTDARIVWGNGTAVANLVEDIDFTTSWNLGDYREYARLNPHLVIWEEELWWCPTPLRPCIRFFYFPWDRRTEETQTDEENRLYFETRDELIAAVQRDGDRAWERVHLLQVEHNTLDTRFRELEGVPP